MQNVGEMLIRALLLGVLLTVGTLTASCSSSGNSDKTLELADIGWTENTAVVALTEVLLEDQLGYQVTVHTKDLDTVYASVA
jgi:ABC-type proline/glycine betaine transport system substrate-binding protein